MSDEKVSSGIELDKLDLSSLMKPQEPPPAKKVEKEEAPPESIEEPEEGTEVGAEPGIDSILEQADRSKATPKSKMKIVLPIISACIVVIVLAVWQFKLGPFASKDYSSAGPPYSLGFEVKQSAEALSKSLSDLDQVGSKISTRNKIAGTVAAIDDAKRMLAQYARNIETFRNYISSNENKLRTKGLAAFITLDKVYRSETVVFYCKRLKAYLDEYKLFLDYYDKHWESISDGQQPQRQTYDLFIRRHREKQDKLDLASAKYFELMQASSENNSVISEFLPQSVKASNGWQNLLKKKTKR